MWGVGLATQKVDLNKVPLGNDSESWVLCYDGVLRHNNEEKGKVPEIPQEGDIIVSILRFWTKVQLWKLNVKTYLCVLGRYLRSRGIEFLPQR